MAPLALVTVLGLAFAAAAELGFELVFELVLVAARAVAAERDVLALRLAAAAFTPLETLFLRVFCGTACAWNSHAPVRCYGGLLETQRRGWSPLKNALKIAHFPQKSMIYAKVQHHPAACAAG